MGWRSIHWNRSEYRQSTRFERYADDSWMLLLTIFGRTYIAFKGQRKWRGARDPQAPHYEGRNPTSSGSTGG